MLYDTIVAFDHFFNVCKIITYVRVPQDGSSLEKAYKLASSTIERVIAILSDEHIPIPEQLPIMRGQPSTSNFGQQGYHTLGTATGSVAIHLLGC